MTDPSLADLFSREPRLRRPGYWLGLCGLALFWFVVLIGLNAADAILATLVILPLILFSLLFVFWIAGRRSRDLGWRRRWAWLALFTLGIVPVLLLVIVGFIAMSAADGAAGVPATINDAGVILGRLSVLGAVAGLGLLIAIGALPSSSRLSLPGGASDRTVSGLFD